ncbi:MAG: hypothetical protein ACOVN5_07655 [Aquidulcibacter sp.]
MINKGRLSDPGKQLWSKAREHAALLGAFEPEILLERLDGQAQLEALTALSEECSEVVSKGEVLWQLNPDVRRAVLSDLSKSGRLIEVAAATRVSSGDTFGHFLTQAAKGTLQIPTGASLADLDILRSALQFTAHLDPVLVDANAVEREIARVGAIEAQNLLLPNSLIGRDYQLRRMRAFCYDHDHDHNYDNGELRQLSPPVLLVSGVGGSGKSALLAEFARRHRRRFVRDFPVIWLDFDRAALASATGIGLTLEFARQLALAVPSLMDPLEDFRKDLSERYDHSLDEDVGNFSLVSSRQSEIWSLWKHHGLAKKLEHLPLILVLDTIEEIMIRDDGRIDQLVRWIDALGQEGCMVGVRTILSGRALDGRVTWSFGLRAVQIQLADLHPISAVRLLERMLSDAPFSLNAVPSPQLIERYGGNPLTLKILARHLNTEGLDGAFDMLEGDDAPLRAEMAQRYLYTRILGRIRTDYPELVRIAHPGLVLRRVTPQIIREVLAGPCDLGEIDQNRATQLFDALSRQVWLVEGADGGRVVRHRRDLRRLVIAAMSDADRAAARQIHISASRFYGLGLDSVLTKQEQSVEALYHRLFLTDKEEVGDFELQMLASALGEDAADLPATYRARIKLIRGGSLEAEELASLSPDRAEDEKNLEARKRLVNRETFFEMPRVYRSGPRVYNDPTPERVQAIERSKNPSVRAEEAYVAGDLDSLLAMSANVIDEFVDEILVETRRFRHKPKDITDYAIWRVMLASLGRPQQRWLSTQLKGLVERDEHRVEWSRPLDPNSKKSITVLTAVQMSLQLLGEEVPAFIQWRAAEGIERSDRVTKTEELRSRQLLVHYSRRKQSFRVDLALLCFLDRSSEKLLKNGRLGDPVSQLEIDLSRSRLLDILDRSSSRPPNLSEIQGIRLSRDFVTVEGQALVMKPFSQILRGMSPELYPLFQAAARQATLSEIEAFTERASNNRAWPRELGREFSSLYLRDPSRWVGTLIETSDRFGLLAELAACLSTNRLDQALPNLLKMYDDRLCNN